MCDALIKNNKFIKLGPSLWTRESRADFAYTDGSAEELHVKKAIVESEDISSLSLELENKIVDWPSEYHLSSERANFLRALNLNNISNVLELGCGCGAVTRYLGEQDIRVDAVEGNPRRAEIASLRCRDLKNINVFNENFNDIVFPENHYDAVFLIGVLEYAKKYFPLNGDEEDAVLKILQKSLSSLKKDGLLIIAIENRLGLKYWTGAYEDHYGRPYVGLMDYPQSDGIRTFDQDEWEDIIAKTDADAYRFIFPFPDYKQTKVMLSDTFLENDSHAYSLLYRIDSKDYHSRWRTRREEFLLWKALHKKKSLGKYANSFVLLISNSPDNIDNCISFDFAHFSGRGRKVAFRTITTKSHSNGWVEKHRMIANVASGANGSISQNIERSEYIEGELLSTVWLEALYAPRSQMVFEETGHAVLPQTGIPVTNFFRTFVIS